MVLLATSGFHHFEYDLLPGTPFKVKLLAAVIRLELCIHACIFFCSLSLIGDVVAVALLVVVVVVVAIVVVCRRCFGVIEQITLDPSIAERQALDERVMSQEGVMGARLSNVIFAVLQQCSPPLFQVRGYIFLFFFCSEVFMESCKLFHCPLVYARVLFYF